jgi:signal transduction histidine kinase
MDSEVRDVLADGRHRAAARWLVLAGLVVWAAGLLLWELSVGLSVATALLGGGALTYGLGYLARGTSDTGPPFWTVSIPVAVSLVLISQGVGQGDYVVRVVLVGLGTLGIILVFLQILDERLVIERRLAERTLVDERRRLAGEVHDVVGHTLSASMLHTTAARLSVRSDPDAAIASLERAEQQGRRSMDDIRSIVRLLRDTTGTEVPARLVGDLPALVEGFRSAGVAVAFTMTDRLEGLPTATALTVYRLVQEGLTNAVRHGTGAIEVTVGLVDDHGAVDIAIVNDRSVRAAATVPGSGLAGMRERVAAIDGTLEAGPTDGGRRWLLHAMIPT